MATLTYSISGDFSAGVDPSLLQQQVLASECVSVLSHINTDGDDCVLVFETEPSTGDEAIVDALVAAHVQLVRSDKNFLVAEYNSRGNVTKETWYGTDDGDGTYSNPVEETVYTYGGAGNKLLLSKTVTELFTDGTPVSAPVVWEYVTNGDVKIMKKVGA